MEFLIGGGKKASSGKSPLAAGGTSTGLGSASGGKWIKDSDTASFVVDVMEASMQVPVIVDFWAPWCGPCKTLGPLLEKLVNEAKGAVRLVKIDVDKNQELAMQMRIQSIPAVYAFHKGRPVDGFVGAVADSQVKSFVARLIGAGAGQAPGLAEILAEAKNLLAAGEAPSALAVYQDVLGAEPENDEALAGLLRCLIALGQLAQAQAMLAQLPPEQAKLAAVQSAKTALELALQAKESGSAAEFNRKLEANPDDHQARFDLAMAFYAAGNQEAAVEALLEIFRRNRSWNDDAARKQLIKLFEAFGPMDPLTISARKRLSSLMFA
ncbi:MAG TPA: thioredoxin [Rhodospirillaceae bacterium]|nr:thioredoxin [Rhodospirillaceae bacterium]